MAYLFLGIGAAGSLLIGLAAVAMFVSGEPVAAISLVPYVFGSLVLLGIGGVLERLDKPRS